MWLKEGKLGAEWVTIAQIVRESIFFGVLFLGFKKIWVFGWQYLDVRKERDAWRRVALRGTNLAEIASEIEGKGSKTEDE